MPVSNSQVRRWARNEKIYGSLAHLHAEYAKRNHTDRLDAMDQRQESRLAVGDDIVRHGHECDSCGERISGGVLRVSLSPPGRPWRQLKMHDLLCLLDFLEDEEEGKGVIFTEPHLIDAASLSL